MSNGQPIVHGNGTIIDNNGQVVTSGNGEIINGRHRKHHHPPLSPHGYLTLRGHGPRGGVETISVMCGDNPPTITDGYANWQVIARPLMRGVSVFQGSNPAQMKVELRFGVWTGSGWRQDDNAGRIVEQHIQILEWMAGGASQGFNAGPSPIVYVNSYGARGGSNNLVPSGYQQTAAVTGPLRDKRLWPWVINGGLTWGNAVRNRQGYRVWQDCSFTLMNYINFSRPPTRTQRGGYFHTTRTVNTALLIAESTSSHAAVPPVLAARIVHSPKNRHLHLRSTRQKIKPGKKVWVPAHEV